MEPKALNLLYFSPNGSCRRVAHAIARGIDITPVFEYDRTLPVGRRMGKRFLGRDLVVVVMPCYGKRLPRVIDGIMAGITASKTPAVFVIAYGNEDYGDSLLELKNTMTRRGFIGIATAAISSAHSLSAKVGAQRPDAADTALLETFGRSVREKLLKLGLPEFGTNFVTPGVFPYRKPPLNLQMPPTSTASCHTCLTCVAICPMGAVDSHKPENVEKAKCISCSCCVRSCPHGCRIMQNEIIHNYTQHIEQHYMERRESEFFM